jgi:hypothetical protein
MKLKLAFLIFPFLLINCGKNNNGDYDVQFFNDDAFTFYDSINFSYRDSEFLEDESLVIAGYENYTIKAFCILILVLMISSW